MAHSHLHAPHDHAHHAHDHAHGHTHEHSHAPHAHPAQPVAWSLLRMTAPARLALALIISAVLWAAVLLAMR